MSFVESIAVHVRLRVGVGGYFVRSTISLASGIPLENVTLEGGEEISMFFAVRIFTHPRALKTAICRLLNQWQDPGSSMYGSAQSRVVFSGASLEISGGLKDSSIPAHSLAERRDSMKRLLQGAVVPVVSSHGNIFSPISIRRENRSTKDGRVSGAVSRSESEHGQSISPKVFSPPPPRRPLCSMNSAVSFSLPPPLVVPPATAPTTAASTTAAAPKPRPALRLTRGVELSVKSKRAIILDVEQSRGVVIRRAKRNMEICRFSPTTFQPAITPPPSPLRLNEGPRLANWSIATPKSNKIEDEVFPETVEYVDSDYGQEESEEEKYVDSEKGESVIEDSESVEEVTPESPKSPTKSEGFSVLAESILANENPSSSSAESAQIISPRKTGSVTFTDLSSSVLSPSQSRKSYTSGISRFSAKSGKSRRSSYSDQSPVLEVSRSYPESRKSQKDDWSWLWGGGSSSEEEQGSR